MATAAKTAAIAALAGSAAAFSGLAPAGLKPASGKLSGQRLGLRAGRHAKVPPIAASTCAAERASGVMQTEATAAAGGRWRQRRRPPPCAGSFRGCERRVLLHWRRRALLV